MKPEMTPDYWHTVFEYDETSPTCLRWKKHMGNGRIKPGTPAGCGKPDEKGSYRVNLNGKTIMCNRVIWEMHYGAIPEGFCISFLDGDPHNLRIRNLEPKTYGQVRLRTSIEKMVHTSCITKKSYRVGCGCKGNRFIKSDNPEMDYRAEIMRRYMKREY